MRREEISNAGGRDGVWWQKEDGGSEEAARIYRQGIVAQQQTKNVQVPLSKSCEEEALETFTFSDCLARLYCLDFLQFTDRREREHW